MNGLLDSPYVYFPFSVIVSVVHVPLASDVNDGQCFEEFTDRFQPVQSCARNMGTGQAGDVQVLYFYLWACKLALNWRHYQT